MEKKQQNKEKGFALSTLILIILILLILTSLIIFGIYVLNDNSNTNIQESFKNVNENEEVLIQEDAQKVQTENNENRMLITQLQGVQTSKIKAKDICGNNITIPEGFMVRTDLGDTVQKGIVIEDEKGNQFVWIPVSNIDGSGTNPIVLDNGTTVEITLGRYILDDSGILSIQQKGSEYEEQVSIYNQYQESSTYREASTDSYIGDDGLEIVGINTTARNLSGFIKSVEENYGYYIARYEASYGSGSTISDYKPESKASKGFGYDNMNYNEGTLWNFISQDEAAKVSQNMYNDNNSIESDLINSYAWDTAVLYIQSMGNENYANANGATNSTIKNTGDTGDVKCNIYDLAGNLSEWSTEYSSHQEYPNVNRGGYASDDLYVTMDRDVAHCYDQMSNLVTFRVIVYNK